MNDFVKGDSGEIRISEQDRAAAASGSPSGHLKVCPNQARTRLNWAVCFWTDEELLNMSYCIYKVKVFWLDSKRRSQTTVNTAYSRQDAACIPVNVSLTLPPSVCVSSGDSRSTRGPRKYRPSRKTGRAGATGKSVSQ